MKSSSSLKFMIGSTVLAVGVLLSTEARAHGGLSMAEDMCKLTVGPYMMHFTGYQPEKSQAKQFCEDIPDTGETVVVLDYIEQELRELPLELRIIKDTGSEENIDAITVLHLPPKVYATGSVDFTHRFDIPGKFVGLVTVGEKQEYVSRFPFSVGEFNFFTRYFYSIYWIPVLAVIAVGALLFFKRDRSKPPATTTS